MSFQTRLLPLTAVGSYWCETLDGDPQGRALYQRHYSARRYRDGRFSHLFVGPGEKLVLVTAGGDALFVWRKFVSDDAQEGVNCAVFRNEGKCQSSAMIRDAVAPAWGKWPGERLYTYVNPQRVASANPGFCFLKAGWRRCQQRTKGGLHVFELLPESAQ